MSDPSHRRTAQVEDFAKASEYDDEDGGPTVTTLPKHLDEKPYKPELHRP